jgi:hypothetical protein
MDMDHGWICVETKKEKFKDRCRRPSLGLQGDALFDWRRMLILLSTTTTSSWLLLLVVVVMSLGAAGRRLVPSIDYQNRLERRC